MTNERKFDAICERLKSDKIDMEPEYISMMVIIGYLNYLADMGMIETGFQITDSGKRIRAICEEFDWKPSDNDIKAFVMEMVEESERPAMAFLVKQYRDEREWLLEELRKVKETKKDAPEA